MSLRWRAPGRVLGAFALLVAALPAHAGVGVTPLCDDIAISPVFARDATMFCVGREQLRADVAVSGVAFFRSADRGRTWVRTTAAGLTWRATSTWRQVVVSPNYARDRAVFVQDNEQGLFLSTDDGATFALVDPLIAFDDDQPSLSPATSQAVPPHFPGPLLYAGHGTVPMLLGPPLRMLVPSVPPTVVLRRFLALAGTTPASRTFAVATNKNGSNLAADHTIELYACDETYACARRLASFPPGMALREAHLTAGFDRRPGIVLTLYRYIGAAGDPVQVWTSFDGGTTFTRARGLERLLPNGRSSEWNTHVYLDTLDGTRQYALVHDTTRTRSLYYSGDAGRTWSRRAASTFGSGEMPSPTVYSYLYAHRLWLLPNGALAVVGLPNNSSTGNAFACSVDGGRRWRPTC